MFSLGMVHIDLEETHGSILLPRSQQQRFCISLSRMRYGEGMVVVKEVMEAVIWFRGLTNLSLSHLCTASSLCEKTRSDAASYMRSLPMWLLKAEAKLRLWCLKLGLKNGIKSSDMVLGRSCR
ncbi:unnamed protein product [Brassica oleracea var. botrytis]